MEKGLRDWFQNSTIEFIENKVESTVFNGGTVIQTVIFAIKSTPKYGGKPVISRGRSMVVYIRDKSSPTGWLSLREMAQKHQVKPNNDLSKKEENFIREVTLRIKRNVS